MLDERPSLLVRGVDGKALGNTSWTDVRFRDSLTAAEKNFQIHVRPTFEAETLQLEIVNWMQSPDTRPYRTCSTSKKRATGSRM